MAAAALKMSRGEDEAAEVQIEQPQRPGEWRRVRRERTEEAEGRGGGIVRCVGVGGRVRRAARRGGKGGREAEWGSFRADR